MALVRRASEDGARYCRIRKYGQITANELAERAFAEFDLVPWPQRFVFYWDGFREGYRRQKETAHDGA